MKLSALTKYILHNLYSAALLVPKIEADKDAEYLHEFRVALRRTRSLLKLYHPDSTIFPKSLKEILRDTNPLREIDVFLLSLDPKRYKHTYQRLEIIRKNAYESLFTDVLKQRLIALLDEFYDAIYALNLSLERDALIQIAFIHYEESMYRYQNLSADAAKKELHALRIRFKISRYGLEFLHDTSLKHSKEQISGCKQFQNQFGEIQDLHNQIQWLKTLYKDYPHDEFEHLLHQRKKTLKKLKAATQSA